MLPLHCQEMKNNIMRYVCCCFESYVIEKLWTLMIKRLKIDYIFKHFYDNILLFMLFRSKQYINNSICMAFLIGLP